MKRTLIILFVVLMCDLAGKGQAQAFLLQDSIEFYNAYSSPYPNVLSPPIDNLPEGFTTVNVGYDIYYYFEGVFYQKIMRVQKYVIVPPPVGAVVITIPQGYELMLINGVSYYEIGNVYYKRVLEGYRVIFPPV